MTPRQIITTKIIMLIFLPFLVTWKIKSLFVVLFSITLSDATIILLCAIGAFFLCAFLDYHGDELFK